mmetsp:Transcript_39890/g.127846  ORF Transcript_39890/g.127846 Transcript_39890/m.127846 type:complete len:203 (-) Transcript_39890:88-696(-)
MGRIADVAYPVCPSVEVVGLRFWVRDQHARRRGQAGQGSASRTQLLRGEEAVHHDERAAPQQSPHFCRQRRRQAGGTPAARRRSAASLQSGGCVTGALGVAEQRHPQALVPRRAKGCCASHREAGCRAWRDPSAEAAGAGASSRARRGRRRQRRSLSGGQVCDGARKAARWATGRTAPATLCSRRRAQDAGSGGGSNVAAEQ